MDVRIVKAQTEECAVHADAVEFVALHHCSFAPVPNAGELLHLAGIFLCDIRRVVSDDGVLANRRDCFPQRKNLHSFHKIDIPEMVTVLFGLLLRTHIRALRETREDRFSLGEEPPDEFFHSFLLGSGQPSRDGTETAPDGVSDVFFHGKGEERR